MCSDTLSRGRSRGPGPPPPAARSPGAAFRGAGKRGCSPAPRARLTQQQPSHRHSSLRVPAIARSPRRGGHSEGARGRRPGGGRTSEGAGARAAGARTRPERDREQPSLWRWRLADRQVGSSPPAGRRTLQEPAPLGRREGARVSARAARGFSGSVSTRPPLFTFGHTRPERGAGDGNAAPERGARGGPEGARSPLPGIGAAALRPGRVLSV